MSEEPLPQTEGTLDHAVSGIAAGERERGGEP
eukprot:SAG11_NODE_20141_length_452_cov_0.405099_1_plen_31_part_10